MCGRGRADNACPEPRQRQWQGPDSLAARTLVAMTMRGVSRRGCTKVGSAKPTRQVIGTRSHALRAFGHVRAIVVRTLFVVRSIRFEKFCRGLAPFSHVSGLGSVILEKLQDWLRMRECGFKGKSLG
jgi:hypothetical protein